MTRRGKPEPVPQITSSRGARERVGFHLVPRDTSYALGTMYTTKHLPTTFFNLKLLKARASIYIYDFATSRGSACDRDTHKTAVARAYVLVYFGKSRVQSLILLSKN